MAPPTAVTGIIPFLLLVIICTAAVASKDSAFQNIVAIGLLALVAVNGMAVTPSISFLPQPQMYSTSKTDADITLHRLYIAGPGMEPVQYDSTAVPFSPTADGDRSLSQRLLAFEPSTKTAYACYLIEQANEHAERIRSSNIQPIEKLSSRFRGHTPRWSGTELDNTTFDRLIIASVSRTNQTENITEEEVLECS